MKGVMLCECWGKGKVHNKPLHQIPLSLSGSEDITTQAWRTSGICFQIHKKICLSLHHLSLTISRSLTKRVAWNSCQRNGVCKRLANRQDTSKQCLPAIPSSRPLPCKNWRGWRWDFEAILFAMPKKQLRNIRQSLQDSQQNISVSAMGGTLLVSYKTCSLSQFLPKRMLLANVLFIDASERRLWVF